MPSNTLDTTEVELPILRVLCVYEVSLHEGAKFLVAAQSPRGSRRGEGTMEGDPVIATALALLFLAPVSDYTGNSNLQRGPCYALGDFHADGSTAGGGIRPPDCRWL